MGVDMAKVIFSVSVTKGLNNELKKDIRESIIGSKEMANEIKRVLQMANRRAQNIEKSGVVSPAYQALVLEGRQGYSKFKITGLDINNESQWQQAKYEYAKAIEYLNNPTSSSTGAKQYINHLSKKYDIPKEQASNILRLSTSTEFSNNKIPLLNYRSMIDTYINDSKNVSNEMKQNAEQHAKSLEQQVQNMTNEVLEQVETLTDYIANQMTNAFKIK